MMDNNFSNLSLLEWANLEQYVATIVYIYNMSLVEKIRRLIEPGFEHVCICNR